MHLFDRKLQDVLGNKSVREKWLIFIVIILCCACLGLIAAKYFEVKPEICRTDECLQSASSIMTSLNTAVKPCDNFYEYACGNWKNYHPPGISAVNNWFTERTLIRHSQIAKLLEKEDDENDLKSLKQARKHYRLCMDTETLDRLGYNVVFMYMKKAGLPINFPGYSTSRYHYGKKFNLARSLGSIQRHMSLDLIIAVSAVLNPNDNRTTLHLSPLPNSISPLPEPLYDYHTKNAGGQSPFKAKAVPNEELLNAKVLANIEYMVEVIAVMFPNEQFNTTLLATYCLEIFIFESSLMRPLTNDPPQEFTFKTFKEYMYSNTTNRFEENLFDWESFIEYLTEGTNSTLTMDDKVLVNNPQFFLELQWKLIDTPTETIQQFLWWKIAEVLVSHTTTTMQTLKFNLIHSIIPIAKQLTRPQFCTQVVKNFGSLPIAHHFFLQDDLHETSNKIRMMTSQFQEAFKGIVSDSGWMDDETEILIHKKIDSLTVRIGYPELFKMPEEVDKLCEDYQVQDGQYLVSMLTIKSNQVVEVLQQLGHALNQSSYKKQSEAILMDLMEVNAFYSRQDNSINILPGIMQIPFYYKGVDVVNYGAIGSIIGHEITHGFDIEGKDYDLSGNIGSRWTQHSVYNYLFRAMCFVEQYDNFKLDENVNLNGTLTLVENLADNIGVKQAWITYKSHHIGKEFRLPGLENYSNDQLFFLSYANVWCQKPENYSIIDILIEDLHSPNAIRVLGTLRNSQEFSEAFKCPAGSPMNPHSKCKVW